jgi:hypothetical protein
MRTFAATLGLLLLAGTAHADKTITPEWVAHANLPPEVYERIADVLTDHDVDLSLNPFYQRADFDGDKKADYAIAFVSKTDKKQRVLVVRGKKSAPIWLDDVEFPALDDWYVHDRKIKIEVGITGGKPPKLKGDALYIAKQESSSAIVYWNGKKFTSYWQGD